MPTLTRLANHRKRRQSNQTNDSANRRTKRRRLDSLADDDTVHDENKIELKREENSQEFHRMSRPRLLPKRGITSMKCSFGDRPDGHQNTVSLGGLDLGRELKSDTASRHSQNFMKNEVSRLLIKKNRVDEYCEDKKDSYAFEGKNVGVNPQPIKSEPVSPPDSPLSSPLPVSATVSSIVLKDYYVHRMANLNAKACVAAYFQPDKKLPAKRRKRNRWCRRKIRSTSKTKCDVDDETAVLNASPKQVVLDVKESTSNPVILNVSGVENVIPVITFSGMKMPPCAVVVEGLDAQSDDVQAASYNTMGLLHNGDTLHPQTRVFLEGSHELHLPSKIVPTLVPARQSTVRRAVEKAVSVGVTRHNRKPAKRKNNGWCPLGEPIKVIENQAEGLCKTYYAGIKRKNEEIFVRDCVVINAGSEKRKSIYIAKIGSIWRQPDGPLMMTTFWYYQPDDVEICQAGIQCLEREILASQHHDVNSVACIDDKCFVIGLSQYCRYHASLLKGKTSDGFGRTYSSNSSMVPRLPITTTAVCKPVIDLVELDPLKQKQEDQGPSLSQLQQVDPSLVFLCYRGFNHISDKLQSGKAIIPLARV